MELFIGMEDVELPHSHCSLNYTTEASQLGLAPGFFPKAFETELGNRQNFVLESVTEERALYTQVAGCISLTVYND